MNTEPAKVTQRIERLETQTRRLRVAAYLIWPAVWSASILVIFMTTRVDAGGARIFLRWFQEAFFGTLVVLICVLALGILIKIVHDFRNRGSRFVLNPGSKRH